MDGVRTCWIKSTIVSRKHPKKKKKSTSFATVPIFAKARSKIPEQRVTDQYDDLPNSWTFGVFLFGELYSSVRISVLTPDGGSPCSAEAFGEILHPRLDRGEVIIDPARFVADPDKVKRFPELPYLTLRLAYMACEYFNADLGLAIVRAEHQAFYRRVFLHETIAEPRMFPGLLKPVGLMAADFPTMKEKVFERYPMMRSTAFERRMLFERAGARRAGRRSCNTSGPRWVRIPEPVTAVNQPSTRVGFRPASRLVIKP